MYSSRTLLLTFGILLLISLSLFLAFVPVPSVTRAASEHQVIEKRAQLDGGSGPWIFRATHIDAYSVNLHVLPDLLHPTLTFGSAKMTNVSISHKITNDLSIVLNAPGETTGTKLQIRASVFKDIGTALGSFTNKLDLLVLVFGGTIHHLTMKNVDLEVDRYIKAETLVQPNLKMGLVPTNSLPRHVQPKLDPLPSPTASAMPPPKTPTPVLSVTATPGVGVTGTPGTTPGPGVGATATPLSQKPTVTPKPRQKCVLWPFICPHSTPKK